MFLASQKEDVIDLLLLIHLDNENRSMAIKFFYMLFMLKYVSHNMCSCSSQMRSVCINKKYDLKWEENGVGAGTS